MSLMKTMPGTQFGIYRQIFQAFLRALRVLPSVSSV